MAVDPRDQDDHWWDDTLTSRELEILYVEVSLGVVPEHSKLPDTPKVRRYRERAEREIEAMPRGVTLDIGFEF